MFLTGCQERLEDDTVCESTTRLVLTWDGRRVCGKCFSKGVWRELKQVVDGHRAQVEPLQERLQKAAADLEAANIKVADLRRRLKTAETEHGILLQNICNDREVQTSKEKRLLDRANVDLEGANTRIRQLEKRLKEAEKEGRRDQQSLCEARDLQAATEQKLRETIALREKAVHNLQVRDRECEVLDAQLNRKCEENRHLKAVVKKSDGQLLDVSRSFTKEIQQLTCKIKESDRTSSGKDKVMAALIKENTMLKSRLASQTSANANLHNKIARMMECMKDLCRIQAVK